MKQLQPYRRNMRGCVSYNKIRNMYTTAPDKHMSKITRVLLVLSAISFPQGSPATTVNYNLDVKLTPSQFDAAFWGLSNYALPSPTLVNIGDTVEVNINFTNGSVLFGDNGSIIEFATFGLNSASGTSKPVNSQYYMEFDILDTGGDLAATHFQGISSSASFVGSVLGSTLNLGQNTLTDSAFSFGGLSFLFTINAGSTGYPDTFTAFDVLVIGGDVSFAVVPVPAAAWLFGSGLLGLIGTARKKAA
ncbi:MAG: hypothetical protein R3F42_04400 [Pseudomonadota bacterium]